VSSTLIIVWQTAEANGWTDLIPLAWFSGPDECATAAHAVVSPRAVEYQARCDIRLLGPDAELDYLPYRKSNPKVIDPGILRLEFTDRHRRWLKFDDKALWKAAGRPAFYCLPARAAIVDDAVVHRVPGIGASAHPRPAQ
jgi:hypothetical protein